MNIDLAVLYVAGPGMDKASCTYKNLLTNQDQTFTADYKVHAVNHSPGLSYSF